MTAVDTNVLVYGHRSEFLEHKAARRLLESLADGDESWGLPVFCLAEFLRVVTHPTFFRRPSSLETATAAIRALLESPSVQVLMPGERFPALLVETVMQARVTGNLIFDAQIAALCREHGASTIWSNDRDFSRFSGLKARPVP